MGCRSPSAWQAGKQYRDALKRGLRYLKGSKNLGLVYSFSGSKHSKLGPKVYGYYDASWADDVDTRRTTMAYVFFLGGCAISWSSKLHSSVTTSSNHSEYCCAATAGREAKYLEGVTTDLGFASFVRPIHLFSDSAGAISMCYNPVKRSASKHVDIADHYARELVARGVITISHKPTSEMVADALTKALPRQLFQKHIRHMVGDTSEWM